MRACGVVLLLFCCCFIVVVVVVRACVRECASACMCVRVLKPRLFCGLQSPFLLANASECG